MHFDRNISENKDGKKNWGYLLFIVSCITNREFCCSKVCYTNVISFFLPNLAAKNYKTTAAIIDRRAYDENQFKEAGLAPVRKTYRFDPTKRVNTTPKK